MRMSQLKKLVVLAIAAAVLMSIPRFLRNSSPEWDPNLALGSRESNAHIKADSKLPIPPIEREKTKEPAKKAEEVHPLEYEKKILLQDELDLPERMQKINDFRQEGLAKECTKLKLSGIIPSNEDIRELVVKPEILVSDQHKAVLCSTGSEYSEKWRSILGGSSLRSLFSYREESISYRLRYYFKILPVEQPLVRFLSAYKKFLTPKSGEILTDSHGRDIGRELEELSAKIRQEFGVQNVTSERNVTDTNARLADFAKFVIKGVKNSDPLYSFWERIHILCRPCTLYYDYISRHRTAKQDSKFIFSKLEKMPPEQYEVDQKDSSYAETFEEMKRELEEVLLNEIYNAYKIDHDLFGYKSLWE